MSCHLAGHECRRGHLTFTPTLITVAEASGQVLGSISWRDNLSAHRWLGWYPEVQKGAGSIVGKWCCITSGGIVSVDEAANSREIVHTNTDKRNTKWTRRNTTLSSGHHVAVQGRLLSEPDSVFPSTQQEA